MGSQCILSTGSHKSETMFAFVLLLFASSASASLDPRTITFIQEQTASVAERSLGLMFNNTIGNCLMNKYCTVAAAPTARIPADSIASGLSMSFEVINKALENNAGRNLPNMMRIKTAFELGRQTLDADLCEKVLPCGVEINLPTEAEVQARIAVPDCDELNMVCPGLSIGCSLCGGHIPGLCGPMCPLAGLFCGSSGYFCTFAETPRH